MSSVQAYMRWLREATPPDFVLEAQRQGWAPPWPGGSGGRVGFFSHIGRVWTGDPVFGAFPVGPQTQDRVPDRWRAQRLGTQADVTADLRQQRQGPCAARFPECPRTLVQQAVETLALGGIQHGLDRVWDAGLRGEACQPTLREGVQGVADGLDTTAHVLGDLRRGLALRTGQ